jgi:hypothetical protein
MRMDVEEVGMALDRPIARLLRASVALPDLGPRPEEAVSPRDRDRLGGLAAAAWFHGVPGYVTRYLPQVDAVPDVERERLLEMRRATVRRHLRAIGDLRVVAEALDRAGIAWLVIKGPTLAEEVHGAPDLRSYNDLDVLVSPRELGDAVRELEAVGCQVPPQNWLHLQRGLRGEFDVWLPSGAHLDLHWHLIIDRPVREHFRIDIDRLLAARRSVAVGPDLVPTLAWADTCVYVALHAVLSGSERLIGFKDLQLLMDGGEPIEEVVERARAWSAELAFRLAVTRAVRAIGLPAAADLPDSGADRVWDLLSRGVWRLSPLERQDGTASLSRIVSRATRECQRASFRVLTRNAATAARRAPIELVGGPDTTRLPGETQAGSRDRDAFFREVASR